MQGLPIQNKVVMPTKGEGKVSSHGVVASKEQNESGKASKEIDFSSIFKDVKKSTEVKVDSDIAGAIKSENESELVKNAVSEKLAGTSTNLDKLLNSLKGNPEEGDLEELNNSKPKNNFFPNKVNGEESELQKDSPLEFLVKNSKTGKSAEVDTSKIKSNEAKSFFPNAEKIANNLTPVNSEPVQNLKLVSGEEFVDVKSFKGQDKNQLNSKNGNAELAEVMSGKNQNASKVNGYQNGQSMLNDNLIKLNKEVASKETKESKKSKTSSIEELLANDSKKSNDLSFVKDSQTLVVNQKSDKNFNFDSKTNEAVKVLDLSKTNATTTNQLIEKISDYVMQSNVAGKDHLDLTVKHDSLGQFQIQVNKVPNQQQVDMQIMTSSHEGHKFFVENESALMKSLQQSGINLSDLRIVSSMTEVTPMASSESKQFSSFNHNQNGASQSFESFQSSDYRQGSEKRKDLWNEYRERYGA